jgi:DNA invertase Pin-like site-specific DNA recombinase
MHVQCQTAIFKLAKYFVYARMRVDKRNGFCYSEFMQSASKKKSNKAVAYVRVSTGRQDLSMGMQEERIKLYCQMMGLELVDIIRERAVSAKIKLSKRPEGGKIERLLDNGITHIVALKLDRLFRNAVDALTHVEAWDKAGIALHLVDMGGQSLNTGSSMGKMIVTMLAGFAEFERNVISERTGSALAFKKKSGMVYNHVPFGFVAQDGKLTQDAAEQATIARMTTLRGQGTSYNEIANLLNSEGVATKQGGTWRSQTVKNITEAAA